MKVAIRFSVVLFSCLFAYANAAWEPSANIAGLSTHLYVPSSSSPINGKKALMISLHGCASSYDDMKNHGNFVNAADNFGMVVAIPKSPGGGAGDLYGCWDYYGTDQTRTNKHNGYLISLANTLIARSDLNIDPNQVYITGISSGATQAFVTGCLAPDIFAGIGAVAAPTVGTESFEIGAVATNLATAQAVCEGFAGSNASDFQTQISNFTVGTAYTSDLEGADPLVDKKYNVLNAEVMASIYGATGPSAGNPSPDGCAGEVVSEKVWTKSGKEVVSLLQVQGMTHGWPGGGNTSAAGTIPWLHTDGIAYADYVTEWFVRNNRRASGGTTNNSPSVSITEIYSEETSIFVSGKVSDSDGTISSLTVFAASDIGSIGPLTISFSGSSYNYEITGVAEAEYEVTVTAKDNDNARSQATQTVYVEGNTGGEGEGEGEAVISDPAGGSLGFMFVVFGLVCFFRKVVRKR